MYVSGSAPANTLYCVHLFLSVFFQEIVLSVCGQETCYVLSWFCKGA